MMYRTSLLRAVSGLVPLAGGEILVDGTSVVGWRPERVARLGVAHVPDHRGLFPSLTVGENLRMGLYGAGLEGTDDVAAALANAHTTFPLLAERADEPAGNLSGGQQQMLTIGRALLQRPRLLLLDDMSMGLATAIVEHLFEVIATLRDSGITVVLVEQFVGQALGVADRVVVLEQGRAVAIGTPDEVAHDELAAAYLGDDTVDLGGLPAPPDFVTATVQANVDARRMRALERLAADRGVPVADLLGDLVDDVLGGPGREVPR